MALQVLRRCMHALHACMRVLQGIREEYHHFRDSSATIMLLGPLVLVIGMAWADSHPSLGGKKSENEYVFTPWVLTGIQVRPLGPCQARLGAMHDARPRAFGLVRGRTRAWLHMLPRRSAAGGCTRALSSLKLLLPRLSRCVPLWAKRRVNQPRCQAAGSDGMLCALRCVRCAWRCAGVSGMAFVLLPCHGAARERAVRERQQHPLVVDPAPLLELPRVPLHAGAAHHGTR